jgi:Flp pilus assembly protein TadD
MARRLVISVALVAGAMLSLARAEPYEADPDLSKRDADYASAKAAMDGKSWDEAVRLFNRAAVRHPDNADLQNYLGYANRNLKRYDAALTHYKRAIELDPRHRGAHEYLGETYLLLGDLRSAERHLKALKDICLLPCEQLDDLQKAVDEFQRKK